MFPSPKYRKDYRNDIECTWRIIVNRNSQIIPEFTDFQLEDSKGKRCCDKLEVRNLPTGINFICFYDLTFLHAIFTLFPVLEDMNMLV